LLSQYRASRIGDKNVLDSQGVHGNSVNKWMSALSDRDAQALVGTLGIEIFREMGYRGTVAELELRGIKLPSEAGALSRRSRINEIARIDAERVRFEQWVASVVGSGKPTLIGLLEYAIAIVGTHTGQYHRLRSAKWRLYRVLSRLFGTVENQGD
jgi:hypothetical protein